MAPPEICTLEIVRRQHIRKLTCTTHIPLPVTAFLRNGNQAQRFAVEPKSIRRACARNINQLVHEILQTDGRVLTCSMRCPSYHRGHALPSFGAFPCWETSTGLWAQQLLVTRKSQVCKERLKAGAISLSNDSHQRNVRPKEWKHSRKGTTEPGTRKQTDEGKTT